MKIMIHRGTSNLRVTYDSFEERACVLIYKHAEIEYPRQDLIFEVESHLSKQKKSTVQTQLTSRKKKFRAAYFST